jgi:hypothetical protein
MSITSTQAERKQKLLRVGLFLNAGLLGLIAWQLAGRGGLGSFAWLESKAMAQQVPQPIAGGAGLFLMPAQFASNKWGCYVMDVDAQTLVAYEYNPSDRSLRLVAARSFVFDRQLRDYNTFPAPRDVQKLLELERDRDRLPPEVITPNLPASPEAGALENLPAETGPVVPGTNGGR